jgi:hypothetical protein
MIEVNRELKDIVICALRYSIGRRSYVTSEVTDYIINHPELIDERVKKVMLSDLRDIEDYYSENDNIDLPAFLVLKIWLENLEVSG